jgi:hypothetical protein
VTADTLVEVAVPFLDSRASDLRWALDLPEQPAVATRAVPIGDGDAGGVVELRVLGGSHQVVVRRPGRPDFTETVACRLADATPLPDLSDDLRRPGYRFAARTERHPVDRLAALVDALLERLAGDRRALLGRFPGHPHAVTALSVDAAPPLSWRTWHAYPQAGELVTTRSSLDHREENPCA